MDTVAADVEPCQQGWSRGLWRSSIPFQAAPITPRGLDWPTESRFATPGPPASCSQGSDSIENPALPDERPQTAQWPRTVTCYGPCCSCPPPLQLLTCWFSKSAYCDVLGGVLRPSAFGGSLLTARRSPLLAAHSCHAAHSCSDGPSSCRAQCLGAHLLRQQE